VKRKTILFLTVAAAVWAGSAHAAGMRGVVVAKQHGTLLVAGPTGIVHAVSGKAAVGARVVGARVVGRASRARIHGVVVKRVGATAFLSSNRHLLAVHSADPTPAAPGSVVDTTVTVQPNGELEDENENEVGEIAGTLQISATITAVGAGTVTLSVNGRTVTLDLPNGLTLPASVVGQTVTFSVDLGRNDDDDQGDDHHRGHGGGGGDDD
jgi:hypothetical protein